MAIEKGDIVGDYAVIDAIGSGGMGTVYRIEHLITKRIEAMKVLPLGIGSEPAEERRFEREIQVQAGLQHPNIAAVFNAVRQGDAIALIMEYVQGESLRRILESGPLPLARAVDYAGQVLAALAYAHEKGVIHCDVSPANIIVTPEHVAKLTDFGLARAATDLRLTTPGVPMGSPWYMAPEQVRAVEQLDARADIYATGAVLYEMLTGRKLFDADAPFAIMRAQVETVPPLPSAHNRELPAALDEVVGRALAKDPAARFQTAREFSLAIQAAATGTSRHARPSRTTIAVAGASVAAAVIVCAALLWPKPAAHPDLPRVAADPKPGRVEMAPPPQPPPIVVPDLPLPVWPAPAVRPVRRAPARDPDPVVSGPHESVQVSSPDPPTQNAALVEAPALTREAASAPAVAPAATYPEPDAAAQSPEAANARKPGNRFVRALGKLNPFRKGSKSDPAVPASNAAEKNQRP